MSEYIEGWRVDAAGYLAWWYTRLVDLWEPIGGSRDSICAVKTVMQVWIHLLDILVVSGRT